MEQMIGNFPLGTFHRACVSIVVDTARGLQEDLRSLQVSRKASYGGGADRDVFTNAGVQAQERMERLIRARLSRHFGLIGEENELRVASTLKPAVTLTLDPDDGTRASIRALEERRAVRPGEVSTMLGVQLDGQAVAGYICDVANLVTYARRPGSDRVVRIGPAGNVIDTWTMQHSPTLRGGTLLVHGRKAAGKLENPLTARIVGQFTQQERAADSMGLAVARVAAGDFVGMLRVAGTYVTPWDDTPIQALCNSGQVVPLAVCGDHLRPYHLGSDMLGQVGRRQFDTIFLARRYTPEMNAIVPIRLG